MTGNWRRVAPTDKVVAGSLRVAFLGVKKVALTRLDGEVVAFNNACPHAGAPLSAGGISGTTITCSRHRWTFCAKSGECHTNDLYALRTYEAREHDGWVEVREPEEIW